ncbi:MAG: hypothetical protein J0M18_08040 [Ignavibacteria bacterium]|nr:hypothetical protein [Ignavibacteria bacterium]
MALLLLGEVNKLNGPDWIQEPVRSFAFYTVIEVPLLTKEGDLGGGNDTSPLTPLFRKERGTRTQKDLTPLSQNQVFY